MRSVPDSASADDRSAKARIRDAAIGQVARHGLADTTVRRVADEAGVSPALVIHHYGSMDGLRRACDEHVAAVIREYKSSALGAGPGLDLIGAMESAEFGPMIGYLARVLTDDSDVVARLVDDLVTDAVGYLQQGVDSGILTPTDDPEARAAVLGLWSLGALALHPHLYRLLGIDMTGDDPTRSPAWMRYIGTVMELVGSGIYTEDFASRAREAFASHDAPRTATE